MRVSLENSRISLSLSSNFIPLIPSLSLPTKLSRLVLLGALCTGKGALEIGCTFATWLAGFQLASDTGGDDLIATGDRWRQLQTIAS